MKKKLLILLAALLVLQIPVYASDENEAKEEAPTKVVLDAKTSAFADYIYLTSMYAHPPKLDVFAEKTKDAYYYTIIGDYESAARLFETYISTLTEITGYHDTDYEMISSRISEHASLMGEVYDFYCKVGFKCCASLLTCLSDYINCSQSPEEDGCADVHREEYLKGIEDVHYVMELIDYICRYLTLSYTIGIRNDADNSEEIYVDIIKVFTTPYEDELFDWYNESYLYLKENFDLDYDIEKISSLAHDIDDTESADVQKVTEYIEGMYKVGSDIPEGEYILIRNEDERYFSSVCVSSDGNKDDIITYDLFDTHHYITVNSGQYLELSGCTAISSKNRLVVVDDLKNIPQGTYKVGTDIPAGEYKLTADPDAVISSVGIQDSSKADHDLITYNIIKNTSYITVKNGQYLVLTDCTASLVN